MERLELAIDGMSCNHCVNAVAGALRRMPGVRVERLEIGTATVAYDPGQVSVEAIIDAVNDEGYVACRAEGR
jgi:copper chaperone